MTSYMRSGLTAVMLVALPMIASGQDIAMSGLVSYNQIGGSVNLQVQRIDNFRALGSYSGTLVLQLWATPTSYTGYPLFGYKMAETTLGQLWGQNYYAWINRTVPFVAPLAGTHNIVLVLAERQLIGYQPVSWYNFGFVTVGATLPPPSFITTPLPPPPSNPTPAPTPRPAVPPQTAPTPTPTSTPTLSAPVVAMTSPATTRRSNYALKLDSSEDTSQVRYRIKPPGSRKFGRWTARGMRRGENDDWSARLKLPTRGRWQIQVQTFDANGNPGETRIMVVTRR